MAALDKVALVQYNLISPCISSAVFCPSSRGYWNQTQMVWSRFYEDWMEKVESTVCLLVSFWFGVLSNPISCVFSDEKKEKR